MSKERDDLMEQVRASSQREADAVHLFEAARAREADAQQQLWAVRQELADLRSVASSLSDKLNREAAEEYERKLRESAARARYSACHYDIGSKG
jgi:predicted  nucleic acid-binding Zn-ribbon protein